MEFVSDIDVKSENLLDLSFLSERKVTEFLRERFLKKECYTWAGTSLLAVNPCEYINELYTSRLIIYYKEIWKSNNLDVIKPHIYAIAARVKYRMVSNMGKVNQAIVLTGESGSGKTHSVNHLLGFLLDPKNHATERLSSPTTTCQWANLILKSFGNAQTTCNMDSSRFGKLLLLYYSTTENLGAHIQTYLLEKTRVTNSPNGRNFQIFHQIVSGLNENEARVLNFPSTKNFSIAPFGSSFDKKAFYDTLEAAKQIGISEKDWWSIITVLAAILHLGNVEFQNIDEETCSIKNNEASVEGMHWGCQLLEVEESLLTTLFTSKLIATNLNECRRRTVVSVGGDGEDNNPEEITVNQSHENRKHIYRRASIYRKSCSTSDECKSLRDSLLRFLYESVFQWIVKYINSVLSLGNDESFLSSKQMIGILDIFGFEVFENNSLEQLSINYANEKLQQYYIQNNLIHYQKMMEKEGFQSIEKGYYCDNPSRMAILDTVIGILNDESIMMRRNYEQDFCRKLEANVHLKMSSKTTIKCEFVISHFAGDVTYKSEGMVAKNADKVPDELTEFLSLSSNVFLSNLVRQEDCRKNWKMPTLLAKFMDSLKNLKKTLDDMDVHYVHCIKASPLMKPGVIDSSYLYQQLKYAGILDSINMRKNHFPISLTYKEFLDRYGSLIKINKSKCFGSESTLKITQQIENMRLSERDWHLNEMNQKKTCKHILMLLLNKEVDAQLGKHSIFIMESILLSLEIKKKLIQEKAASIIQNFWRKYHSYSNQDPNINHLIMHDTFVEEDIQSIGLSEKFSQCNSEYKKRQFCENFKRKSGSNIEFQRDKENDLHEKKSYPHFSKIISSLDDYKCKDFSNSGEETGYFNGDYVPCVYNPFNNTSNLCDNRRILRLIHHGDGIKSKQRIPKGPIKFHIRRSCLPFAHCLPRMLLPRGIPDALQEKYW